MAFGIECLLGVCLRLGLPDRVQGLFRLRLDRLGQAVEDIHDFVHPATTCLGIDFLQCGPEPHRTVTDGGTFIPRDFSPSNQTTLLGHSVAHWDGETLVVETAGIQANRLPFNAEHSDQLRVVERYARSKDDDTLVLTATMEDPWGLREPVVIKRIWRWAPESRIDPYEDCELPTEFTRGVTP